MRLKSTVVFAVSLLMSGLFVLQAMAQDGEIDKYAVGKKKIKIGDQAASLGAYYEAATYYSSYMEEDPNDAAVALKTADAYKNSRDYAEAQKWYKKAYDLNKKDEALFNYALMLKYNGSYEEAKNTFGTFMKNYKGNDAADWKKKVSVEQRGCDALADLQKENEGKIGVVYTDIEHLGSNINRAYSDFARSKDDSTLVFTSIRSDSVIWVNETDRANRVTKLYVSKFVNGSWSKSKEFSTTLNSDNDFTGNGSFTPDKKTFYFTRCEESDKHNQNLVCSIYRSKQSGSSWSDPEKLSADVNAPNSSNTQPCITPGQKGNFILYFSSDRSDGSNGGYDLWYVPIAKDGSTGVAANLGKKINTAADEKSPFYDAKNGVLYFSTNGKMSLGGYDIYSSKGAQKKWEEALNIGPPFNSSYDDYNFIISPSGNKGFFASNRKGVFQLNSATAAPDIYTFNYIFEPHFFVMGYAYDDKDVKKANPLEKVLISIKGDGSIRYDTTLKRDITYFFPLNKNTKYDLKAQREGYYVGKTTCSTEGLTKTDTLKVDIMLKKIEKKSYKIQGIFYDFNQADIKPESEPSLQSLLAMMNDNPGISIQINSHTDNKGNDRLNKDLSQRRAQSVVKYLIEHGIDKSRLKAKGFGASRPDTLNTNPDGSDNPEGRAKNRRTEFEVIGSVANTSFIYEQADVKQANTIEKVEAKQPEGVKDASGNEMPVNVIKDEPKPVEETPAEPALKKNGRPSQVKGAKTTTTKPAENKPADKPTGTAEKSAAPATKPATKPTIVDKDGEKDANGNEMPTTVIKEEETKPANVPDEAPKAPPKNGRPTKAATTAKPK